MKIKCKYGHDDKKCETCRIKYKGCECCLEYTIVKNNLIEYKCLCCVLYANHDINKFILLLRKHFSPYEYMGDWEKFIETLLPEKEDFYSHLNMEDITDADYAHTKRV